MQIFIKALLDFIYQKLQIFVVKANKLEQLDSAVNQVKKAETDDELSKAASAINDASKLSN